MKIKKALLEDAGGGLWLRVAGERPARVCSVADAGRRLGKTRRQIYRYLRSGWLENHGKFLGEWLLEEKSVARLAASPPQTQPLPRRLKPLFPEYDLTRLNAGKDRNFLLGRVLDEGGLEDLRWLMRRYPPPVIRRFIRDEGALRLSPRSRRLWSLYFKARPRPAPAWRASDAWKNR